MSALATLSMKAARFPIFSADTEMAEIAQAARDEAWRGFFVQVCSWCVDGLEVDGIEISHGICPSCFEKEVRRG